MQISIAASSARKRLGAFAAAARAATLATVLLFSAGAQADPVVAQQMLQAIRAERQQFDVQMQIVNFYLDNQPSQAQVALASAQVDAVVIGSKLARLYQENRASRENGQYNDLQALERAIQLTALARTRIQYVEVRLQVLRMENPPSAITRAQLNVDLELFAMYMRDLELAMSQA